jgi:predicted nucleotidyltransferase
MNISAFVLYGSCARGDSNQSSDVDLFAITADGEYQMIVKSKVNLALYPKSLALEMAKNGELFMLHLVKEGQSLMDHEGDFQQLKDSFVYKKSYKKEILNSSELGWAIRYLGPSIRNQALVNQRIAWCVRTILIAKAAEKNKAIFSAKSLGEFANENSVTNLIINKNATTYQPKIFSIFEKFLSKWTFSAPLQKTAKLEDYQELFENSQNIVGLKTLKAFKSDQDFDKY